jgi:hypothetical protein
MVHIKEDDSDWSHPFFLLINIFHLEKTNSVLKCFFILWCLYEKDNFMKKTK